MESVNKMIPYLLALLITFGSFGCGQDAQDAATAGVDPVALSEASSRTALFRVTMPIGNACRVVKGNEISNLPLTIAPFGSPTLTINENPINFTSSGISEVISFFLDLAEFVQTKIAFDFYHIVDIGGGFRAQTASQSVVVEEKIAQRGVDLVVKDGTGRVERTASVDLAGKPVNISFPVLPGDSGVMIVVIYPKGGSAIFIECQLVPTTL